MADGAADQRKKLLLNLISEVKARLDGKIDSVNFPIPQFIVVGKQSVGKSRLIEGLAGEPFNFVSGTLGSRRPTVLELRNVPQYTQSRWSVYDEASGQWQQQPIDMVMKLVGQAHESLGDDVTDAPIRVKVEGADTVDLGLVDLPGFRAFARDAKMQQLQGKIESMVSRFMQDENNVMLCVEEAGDAAGFSTLGKCKQYDPSYRRTVLIRNKLDKYYSDLNPENINKWLEGFGDLPETLVRFAVSLPHWTEPVMPKPFGVLRGECADKDVSTLTSKGASQKYVRTIGFANFRLFMEVKTQQLFSEALPPLMQRLKELTTKYTDMVSINEEERKMVDGDAIIHATRQAGVCFAQSFNYIMEGALHSEHNRTTLEEELTAFHAYVRRTGCLKPSEIIASTFDDLPAYITYLRDEVELPGMDVTLNGGAQFKRLLYEVEVFIRFAGLGSTFTEKDIIQSRGSGLHETTWRNTITTLMMQNAPAKMHEKTKYVGERLKWFFMEQKEAVLNFMLTIKGSSEEHMYSQRIFKQAQVIERNETMKKCIFEAFDAACLKRQKAFEQMWKDWQDSMFQSPLQLLKGGSAKNMSSMDDEAMDIAPTLEITKERIKHERLSRGGLSNKLNDMIKEIPDDDARAKQALKMVCSIIEQTFGVIRSAVSDQLELYSKSFFLLPMLRRLEGEMSLIELNEADRFKYKARKMRLDQEHQALSAALEDLGWCIAKVQTFRIVCGGGDTGDA